MQEPSTSTGDLAVGTTSPVVRACRLKEVILFGGSAASSVIVYDNASAGSGTVLARLNAATATSFAVPMDVIANNGLTAVVAGTAAIAVLHYGPS